MISFRSLLRAATKAQQGKRFRPSVAAFHFDLEAELWQLHHDLANKSYQTQRYHTFYVYEPKKRLISAAPYRGYRVFPTHRLLVKDNVRRLRRRVRRMQRQFARREIDLPEIRQRLMSWSGHARQADTYELRRRLFATIAFRRDAVP